VASRFVTGFQVSLDRPSSLTVALALTQAVLPKEGWLSDRQLELSWPAAGLPEALHLDNAAEFKAEALERGTPEYGVRLFYRPPGRPHYGGHIERLIGTMMGAVHLLPGTTFSDPAQKGSYRSPLRPRRIQSPRGFDWTDFHLHRFRIRKRDYAVPRRGGLGCHDARRPDLHVSRQMSQPFL